MIKCVTGVNDLTTTHPQLLQFWDYSKNTIAPTSIMAGSGKKTWWICPKGHSYETVTHLRTSGSTCPYCSNQKVLTGYNDLYTNYPNLCLEWDYEKNTFLKPTEVLYGTPKKAYWKCSEGHSYLAEIRKRVNGQGCPYCKSKLISVKNSTPKKYEDSLEYKYPDLIKEFDYTKNTIKPSEIYAKSHQKVWWICSQGHSYQSIILDRTNNGSGCPYCVSKKVLVGYNDIKTTHNYILNEWDFERNTIKPEEISAYSNKKVWWKCKNEHSWEASPNTRIGQGRNCPYCVNQMVKIGYNDLATTHPDLIKEWDYDRNIVNPTEIVAGTNRKVWWLCKEGHSWQSSVSNRVHLNRGCPVCNSSYTEHIVCEFLDNQGINYEKEKSIFIGTSNRRYDFYIPNERIVIEIDGKQHFQEVYHFDRTLKENNRIDNLKNIFCLTNKVPILRIPGLDILNMQGNKDSERTLCNIIIDFIKTHKIPDGVINYYKECSHTNYYEVAQKMNEF